MSGLDEVRALIALAAREADEAEQRVREAAQKPRKRERGPKQGQRRAKAERKPHAPFWFITYIAKDGQYVAPEIPDDPEDVVKEPAAEEDALLFRSERWFRMLPSEREDMDGLAERKITATAMKLIGLGVRQLDVFTYRTNSYGQRVDHRRILRYLPSEGVTIFGPPAPPKRRGRNR